MRRFVLPAVALAAMLIFGCAGGGQQPGANVSTQGGAVIPAQPPPQQSSGNLTQLPPPAPANPPGGGNAAAGNLTPQGGTANGSQPGATPPAPQPPGNETNQAPQNASNATSPAQGAIQPEGLPFPGSNYSLYLDDVSLVPNAQAPCGIFSIRDPSGAVMDKLLICPPDSEYWTSPEGHMYRIRADEVAAGYTKTANWAEAEIFG
jgi:hypothetical protein